MLSFYCTLIDAEEDKIAFEHIYNTYRKRMFYIANTILKNKEDAEDAVQNALLGIAKTMETVPTKSEDELQAYIYTVSRNAALALLPAKKRREQEMPLSPDLADPHMDVFATLVKMDDYHMLYKLLSALPVQYQEILFLRFSAGLPPRKIAQVLNRKTTTVSQQLTRSKKLLAALYEKEGVCYDG